MNKLVYGLVVTVLIVVVAVAGVFVLNSGGGGALSGGNSAGVADASSLQYSYTVTNSSGTSLLTMTFYAKNIGTSGMVLRVEDTEEYGTSICIFNCTLQKAWTSMPNGQWEESQYYSTLWNIYNGHWATHKDKLASWSGVGDYTYTVGGNTVRIFNISVNPTLDDSLFSPS